MKKTIIIITVILSLLPLIAFSLSSNPYDTNTLNQNIQFRKDLLEDTNNREEKINFKLTNFEQNSFEDVFNYISNIIFYESNTDIYSVNLGGRFIGKTAYLVIDLEYRMTPEENVLVNEWVAKTMDPYLINNPDELEIIQFVNDTIVNHVDYDLQYEKNSAYHAAYNKSSLCEGYSLLAQRMLSYANIESKLISGVAGGENHMWNLVKYNDYWYHLDVTWNDPVFSGSIQKPNNFISHVYFMKSSLIMSTSHTWDANLFPLTTNNP